MSGLEEELEEDYLENNANLIRMFSVASHGFSLGLVTAEVSSWGGFMLCFVFDIDIKMVSVSSI